jgi:hypothetical protein
MTMDHPADCFNLVFNYILYKSIVDAHRTVLTNRGLHMRSAPSRILMSENDYSDRNSHMVRVELTRNQFSSDYLGRSESGAIQPR